MTLRPLFHLTPPAGRLNDPNGVTLVGDRLHVFYQHDPSYGFGPKRTGWGHAVTTLSGVSTDPHVTSWDGVWHHLPDALYPDAPYDKNGVYSGGAVTLDTGEVQIFYTGNLKTDGERHASQNRVFVTDIDGPSGGFYRRDPANPLIPEPAEGYTNHYRDPQIVRLKDGLWRMALGAQTEDEHGRLVVYYSDDLTTWEFAGEIRFEGLPERLNLSYMFECPNLIRMRDTTDGTWYDVAVFCPQSDGSDECWWVVGHLDSLTFTVHDARPVDAGFEFYAPQLIELPDGTALMLGWMGMPGVDPAEPFDSEGWVHCLTVPRLVTLTGGRLYQKLLSPVPPATDHPAVSWDEATRTVTLTRGEETRTAQLPQGVAPDIEVIEDGCALEVTAGGGLVAFSSMLY